MSITESCEYLVTWAAADSMNFNKDERGEELNLDDAY